MKPSSDNPKSFAELYLEFSDLKASVKSLFEQMENCPDVDQYEFAKARTVIREALHKTHFCFHHKTAEGGEVIQ